MEGEDDEMRRGRRKRRRRRRGGRERGREIMQNVPSKGSSQEEGAER